MSDATNEKNKLYKKLAEIRLIQDNRQRCEEIISLYREYEGRMHVLANIGDGFQDSFRRLGELGLSVDDFSIESRGETFTGPEAIIKELNSLIALKNNASNSKQIKEMAAGREKTALESLSTAMVAGMAEPIKKGKISGVETTLSYVTQAIIKNDPELLKSHLEQVIQDPYTTQKQIEKYRVEVLSLINRAGNVVSPQIREVIDQAKETIEQNIEKDFYRTPFKGIRQIIAKFDKKGPKKEKTTETPAPVEQTTDTSEEQPEKKEEQEVTPEKPKKAKKPSKNLFDWLAKFVPLDIKIENIDAPVQETPSQEESSEDKQVEQEIKQEVEKAKTTDNKVLKFVKSIPSFFSSKTADILKGIRESHEKELAKKAKAKSTYEPVIDIDRNVFAIMKDGVEIKSIPYTVQVPNEVIKQFEEDVKNLSNIKAGHRQEKALAKLIEEYTKTLGQEIEKPKTETQPEKDKALKEKEPAEKKGKVKKLPKNNEFTAFEPEKDEFAKNIETYVKLHHSDKPKLVEYLKTASYKENSTLSGLMVSLRSASEPYFKKYKDENQNSTAPTVFGKFTLIDGYLESINLECMSIEGLKKYPSKVKSKKQKALTKEEAKVQAEAKLTQYTALIENVRKFINDPKASKATDPDLRRKALLILNETLRKNGFEDKNISVVEKVEKLEALGIEANMNEMQVLECITDFAHSPRALTKDKKERDMYKDLIEGSKKFFAENGDTQNLSSVRVLSDEEFLQMCADTLVARAISISMIDKENDGHDSLNAVVEKGYRSLKRNNKSLLKDSIKHASEVIRNCGKYSSANIEVLSNATLPKDSPLVDIVKEGFSFDKLPADMIAKIEGMVNDQIQNLGILEVSQELVDDMFKDTFGPEKANETSEPDKDPLEVDPTVLANDAMNGFAKFVDNDQSREKTAHDYTHAFVTDIEEGYTIQDFAKISKFQPLVELFADKTQTVEQKIAQVKANPDLMKGLEEWLVEGQSVEGFVKTGHDFYTAQPDMEALVEEYETATNTKVGDKEIFAKKFACLQQIAEIQGSKDPDPKLQEVLTKLLDEYNYLLKKQLESGVALTDEENKFMSEYAKSKNRNPGVEGPLGDISYDVSNFDEAYDKWKEAYDKKARGEKLSKEEQDDITNCENNFLDQIVLHVINDGSTIGDDVETPTGGSLSDKERSFLGANAGLISTKCAAILNNTAKHNAFCKGILAHNNSGKTIPNVTAERTVENGVASYSYTAHSMKTYEEMFPSTDISAKIAKTVKDLKDAYVYLKPGIKLCDKLIDYIKGLSFDSQTKVNAPSDDKGGNNGSNGSGNGQGNDTPTDDKSKIEALLAEINEKLKELEKAVLMALKGVESEKLKGMQLSGDILAKLTDLNGILTKPDQTKEIVTTYAPQYQVASNSLMNYQMQLMSMGQMQLPIQPLPNGMYAIPGNLLGFMAMANPEMYGAPFANFMGLDPSMFSKMYAQMRPMHLVKVTVTPTIDGVPFKFEVDINLADAHSEDKVAMLKQNINEHIEEFMRQGATQVNVIKADLMAYIDRIARGSQVLDVSLENLATKEKQVLQSNDGNEPEEEKDEKKVEPTVKSSTPVKKEGTKEHAPKPRFDFVIKDKTITITENGKEVISKVIDKALTPAEEAYIRGELNEIQRAEFKNAEEEQFFFNAMFDKLLEGTKTKTQQQKPAEPNFREEYDGMEIE